MMLRLWIRLMFIAALIEMGISAKDLRDCHSRGCLLMIEQKARQVLDIDWKPISVFPEEAKRFR